MDINWSYKPRSIEDPKVDEYWKLVNEIRA